MESRWARRTPTRPRSAKTVSSTLPGFNQRYSSGGGGGGSGAATLQGFTSPHRSSPYSPTPAPAHASTLSGYSEAGNGAALWGSYDPSLQQYGVVTSANSSGTRGRTTSVASLSAAASLSAILTGWSTLIHRGMTQRNIKDESQNKKSPKLFTRESDRENSRSTKILPFIGSLTYCKSSALAHLATEVG
uniref:(California timema) hypothetical protein n=1 Tax=Timema californicum TaxID=61474 RepID=A0A7R9JEF6_TIMCA|nr:unnamed protein product [Timema californicum]